MGKKVKSKSIGRLIATWIFGISCIGIFGGSVNFGTFDFLPAIPYLVAATFIAVSAGKKHLIVLGVVVAISAPLYFYKDSHGRLFHPALGEPIILAKDVCLTKHRNLYTEEKEDEYYVFIAPLRRENSCRVNHGSGVEESKIMLKGDHLKIDIVEVSNPDLDEVYHFKSMSDLGLIHYYFSDKDLFRFENGKLVEEDDLRRGIFYYPSFMMFWPIIPHYLYKFLKE